LPLSSVTEMALAVGIDPVTILSQKRDEKLAEVADDARREAKAGKRGDDK
jgi:hypothetical protein